MTEFAGIDEWIAGEAISFLTDADFNAAADGMLASLDDRVSVLGFGEGMHGGEEFLTLRNRFFQRLVEAHGYRSITLEINDTRARLVDAYISGRGPGTYEQVQDDGFSYGSGRWTANRELVEWIRGYNSDPSHERKLHFFCGSEVTAQRDSNAESPGRALESALAVSP